MRPPRKSSSALCAGALAVLSLAFLEQGQTLRADIQDPPMVRQGPVRKLGRGLSNMFESGSEVITSLDQVNESEGNAAVWYGLTRGVTRSLTRFGVGIYEVLTFPFPTTRGTYGPVLRKPIPWVHGGYEEFPPELGFETRFDYGRIQSMSTRIP